MATQLSLSQADKRKLYLVLCTVLVLSAVAIHWLTYGLRAWTLDQRRDARIAAHALRLPRIDVVTQDGTLQTMFAGLPAPELYIVDFIYTRCQTVCRALGSEFEQLSRRIEIDGVSGRLALVSLSFDSRDTVRDLGAYAEAHRARSPDWQVVATTPFEPMAELLRQADVIVIADGIGGFVHNGDLHVVGGDGTVLAVFASDQFERAYDFALTHVRRASR